MADITIGYKGETIAEISASGTTTLETAGKYCEDDISLQYVRPSAPTQNDDSIYLLRALPYTSYLKQLQKIIGGTVAWNQLNVRPNGDTKNGITVTKNDDGSYTFAGTATANRTLQIVNASDSPPVGHKILCLYQSTGNVVTMQTQGQNSRSSYIHTAVSDDYYRLRVSNGSTVDETVKAVVIDLTLLFGSVIADYVYSLGDVAGVSWFTKLFPNAINAAYNLGGLQSVKPSASKAISPDGNSYAIYPFDSTIELRGILKLDANNNLYYDGDEYTPDGTVTRNVYEDTLTVSSMYTRNDASYDFAVCQLSHGYYGLNSSTGNIIGEKVVANTQSKSYTSAIIPIGTVLGYSLEQRQIAIAVVKGTTKAQAESVYNGSKICYRINTPFTETATPYIEPQACFPNGTEQFVDGRTVEMPVEAVAEYEVTS